MIVPASTRLVVVCNYKSRSVLQEWYVEETLPSSQHDNLTDATNETAALTKPPLRLDWGGMVGGSLDRCDDWDKHQVGSGESDNNGEIRSRNSVAAAAAALAGANASASMSLPSALSIMAQGFGFAVWLSLPNNSSSNNIGSTNLVDNDEEAPIVSLARPRPSSSDHDNDDWNAYTIPTWKECGDAFDLELSYRAPSHELVLRYSDVDGTTDMARGKNVLLQRTCRTLRIPASDVVVGTDADNFTSSSASAVHVAVLWSALRNTLNVYLQGRDVIATPLPQSLNVTLSQWNLDQDHLVIFRGGTFSGGLHQADLFVSPNLPESSSDVASLYRQGFVKTRYDLTGNGTVTNHEANPWLQLDPLEAPNDERRRIAQDSTAPLTLALGGMVRWKRNISSFYTSSSPMDGTKTELALWVNITQLPSHGTISVSNVSVTGLEMDSVGSLYILPLPIQQVAAASLQVDYALTDRSFYNLPHRRGSTRQDAELLEATISVVWKGETVALSPVAIPIQVQQVNAHPPILIAPSRIVVNSTDGFLLSNVSLHDPDAGSGLTPVRVDVASRHSSLELAIDESDDELTFMYDTCHQRSASPWQCVGGGGGEHEGAIPGRLVTFVAPMEDVSSVLQTKLRVNLMRESDSITVRVYDGQDDADCLSAQEHAMYGSNWTLHRGCYEVEASVELVADPGSVQHGAAGGSGLDTSSISRVAHLTFWSLTILLVLGIVACLRRCMPRCLARGSGCGRGAIDADDGSDARRAEEGEAHSDIDCNAQLTSSDKECREALDTTMSDDEFDDVASF